jgi:large subunit ribosomal protein L6
LVDPDIKISVDGNTVVLERPTEQKRHKAMHGLYRALLNNMVEGSKQRLQAPA